MSTSACFSATLNLNQSKESYKLHIKQSSYQNRENMYITIYVIYFRQKMGD